MWILSLLTKWKVYLIVMGISLIIGFFLGTQVCGFFDDWMEDRQLENAFEAEEKLLEDKAKSEVIYRDRINTVIEYVESNTNSDCITAEQLRVFNNEN